MDKTTIIIIAIIVAICCIALFVNFRTNKDEAKASLEKRNLKGFFLELINHIGDSNNYRR